MTTRANSPKKLALALAVLVLLNAINSPAQIYNCLHNFPATNCDGYSPLTDLVLISNTLCGNTASGGTSGNGTIFKLNTDGTGYGILWSLTNSPSTSGGMVSIGDTLYGTMFTGGAVAPAPDRRTVGHSDGPGSENLSLGHYALQP
jgi:hypothetical protein